MELISGTCNIILILESIIGLAGNLFIISVICFKKSSKRDTSDSNKIIASLAASNIIHACILTINAIAGIFWPGFYTSRYVATTSSYLIVYSSSSSIWLSAILCFFYFIKITNFSFFTWVKRRINKLINWMISMALVGSTFCSSLSIIPLLWENHSLWNISASSSNVTSPSEDIFLKNISFISHCIPMFTVVATTTSTLVSLNLHSRRIKKNLGTFGSANSTSYKGVIRIMISFLVFYGLYYGVLIIYCFTNFIVKTIEYWIMLILAFSFTPVQSICIISGAPNLKESWENICLKFKDLILLYTRN